MSFLVQYVRLGAGLWFPLTQMHARTPSYYAGCFVCVLIAKKGKKKEKKRIQITSKQTSRGINCSSLSLSSLKILHS